MRGSGSQNLSNGDPVLTANKPLLQCRWCKKKYRNQQKVAAHVEEQHPFAAINKNTYDFTVKDKLWLLDALESYIRVLKQNNRDTFVLATANLGDLERMLPIHTSFKERIMPYLDKVLSNGSQLLRIIDEFRAFLNLGLTPRGDNWCPSLLIDLVWHSAMQNKEKYLALVSRFINGPLSHCLPENDDDAKRFKAFVRQFQHQHGRDYLGVEELIGTDRTTGFQEAREILKREDEEEKKRVAEEEARWRAVQEQWQRDIDAQKRAGTYKEPVYYDDGKC